MIVQPLFLSGLIAFALPTSESSRSADEEAALNAFRQWAEEIAGVPSIHFRFRSSWTQGHLENTVEGRVDLDGANGNVYIETTESEWANGQPAAPVHRYASFRDGLGYLLAIDPRRERQKSLRFLTVPNSVGRAVLPTSHPYYPGLRSLASLAESSRVVVDKVPYAAAPESNAVYRVGLAWGDPADEIAASWSVFYVDFESEGKLLEQRHYFFEIPDFESIKEPIPPGYELPEEFHARYLHLRRVFHRHKIVDGVAFPTAWEVHSPVAGLRGSVEIDEESFGSARSVEHDFLVPLESGDVVFDTVTRLTSIVGDPREPFRDEGQVDGVSERELDELLAAAGVSPVERSSGSDDVRIPSGCAANCLYVLLATLGKGTALPEIARGLNIEPGHPVTDMKTIAEFLRSRSVKSASVHGTADDVLRSTGATPVLLHVLREGRGHFVLGRSYSALDDTLEIVDPPRALERVAVREVAAEFTGAATIVDPVVLERLSARIDGSGRLRWGLVVAGGAVTVAALSILFRRARATSRRRIGSVTVPCLIGLGLALRGLVGCDAGAGELHRASKGGGILVLGESSVDFGRVKGTNEPLNHTFVLENRSGRTQRILDLKRSCGCLGATPARDEVEDGTRVDVDVGLDGNLIFGERTASAYVVFEDRAQPPVTLQVRAFIEPEYRVIVQPLSLRIPRTLGAGTEIERTFLVTEFMSHTKDYDLPTVVTTAGDFRFTLEQRGPWKKKGWRFVGGYLRQAEFVLRCPVPPEWGASNRVPLKLRFEKEAEPGEQERREEVVIHLTRL